MLLSRSETHHIMLFYLSVVFLTSLPTHQSIGPGLSQFKSRMHSDTGANSASWDSSVLPYTDEANSYAYWNCHTIPPNMTLCKSVGYSRMVLPNFLQHESLREVIQQANVWVALVNTDCHPDIQRFLCSLYAPVCLKSHQVAKIPPCWELCDQVRNACLPRMRLFGFDWPEIVQCKQFPRLAESMCIPPQENTAVKCAPCEQAVTLENIASSYCMADVVLRASIQDVSPVNNRAALHLKLSPKTRALKIARKDGTITTSMDFRQMRRRNRQRKLRHRVLKSRIYRHLDPAADQVEDEESDYEENQGLHTPPISNYRRSSRYGRSAFWPYDDNYKNNQTWSASQSQQRGRKNGSNRRRRARDSDLQDLDGITELQLDCSACSSLIRQNSETDPVELNRKRWLVMGRRVLDDKTKQLTNQVQVTFITVWDRSSVEFRRSMQAIRNQPVSHLCPKQQSAIAMGPQKRRNSFTPTRNLKILRSAPHELSDAPSTNVASTPTSTQLSDRQIPSPETKGSRAPAIVTEEMPKAERLVTQDVHTTNRPRSGRFRTEAESPKQSTPKAVTASLFQEPTSHMPVHQDNPSASTKTPSRLLETQMLYSRWMNRYHSSDGLTRRERRRRRRLERQRWKQISQTSDGRTSSGSLTTGPVRPINPYGNEPSGSYAKAIWVH